MAKLTFTATHTAAYAGEVSDLRVTLTALKSFLEKSPGAATTIKAQMAVFATAMGWTLS